MVFILFKYYKLRIYVFLINVVIKMVEFFIFFKKKVIINIFKIIL